MRAFDYVEPKTLDEAVAALAEGPGPVRALAGGTDLLVRLKRDPAFAARVVNLKRIVALRGILAEESGTSIGALTTIAELAASPEIVQRHPLLVEAALQMASPQVRHLATLGGNLANASPAADMAPPLLCLDAVAHVTGPSGSRTLALAEFFLGPGRNALAPGEILTRIFVPAVAGRGVYLKFSPRAAMDLAIVGVACFAVGNERRVALGAVAPTPIRVPADPTEAARRAQPIDDLRASAEYRRAMISVLVRRALERVAS